MATHALVFQVAELSGETSPLRFRQVVGVYGVTNLTAVILNKLFWRVVRNLHLYADVHIVVSICDGASCNRLFQKMNTHQMGKGTPNHFQPGRCWCSNPFVEDAKIFFMSDPAHWIKKVVTHWEKSKRGGARHLLVPDFLIQLILARCPPPAPHQQQQPERGATCGMEWYCRVFGRVYELLGGSHEPLFRSHAKDGSGLCRLTPPRLEELQAALSIVRAWHAHNSQLPGLSAKQRASHGFSHQLFWDTQMMIEGFLGLLADLQQRHGGYVVRARMLNQDSLESLFGRIRMACGSGRDPSLLKVVQAVPREEDRALARAGMRAGYARARSTNSGQVGQVGGASGPPAWLDRRRIVLPTDFARRCMLARSAHAAPPHEILWETLRAIQVADEKRSVTMNLPKQLYWLTTAKHINKTGFSRMRVGLAIAVLCGGSQGQMMADVLQLMRYDP